jgi:CDP-paratose synthetase
LKNVLITGINGFLGSHLAKQLKANYNIIGLEYSLKDLHRISSDNFEVYLSNERSFKKIFTKYNIYAIIHVATIYRREGEPILNLLKTNINLPTRLLELANHFKIKLFINTDSFFNNSKFSYSYLPHYTLSKKHSLEWIKLYSNDSVFKVINMKIFHMYGENDAPGKFISSITNMIINNEKSIDFTLGDQTRDFIYIKDVVNAFEFVLDPKLNLKKYQEFDVATGSSISLKNFITLIKTTTKSITQLNFGKLPYRKGEIMVSKTDNLSLNKIGWKPLYIGVKGVEKYISKVQIKHS